MTNEQLKEAEEFFDKLLSQLETSSTELKEPYVVPKLDADVIKHALTHTIGMNTRVLESLPEGSAKNRTETFKRGLESLLKKADSDQTLTIDNMFEAYCLCWALDENIEFIQYGLDKHSEGMTDEHRRFTDSILSVYQRNLDALTKLTDIVLEPPIKK